jgi:hypothetical protein
MATVGLSDKHGIFRVNQAQTIGLGSGLTQFGRAMQELDIQIICANTPQAKGRIERANAYLPEFRLDFNRRFAVAPPATMMLTALTKTENLDIILTRQKKATLSRTSPCKPTR